MPTRESDEATDLHALAMAAFQRGDVAASQALMAQACAQASAPVSHHLHHAEILRCCGRLDEAEAAGRLAVAREPGGAEAWNVLGAILADRDALAESRDCFAAAVRIDPRSVNGINNLAVMLQRLGELGAADACYRDLLALAPGNLDIELDFAILQGRLGRHREGLAIVDRILARAPRMLKALLFAAELEQDLGGDPAALARLDHAAGVIPEQISILTRRAQTLYRLGRCNAALSDCERALGIVPTDPDALHMRAIALQGLDRADEALQAFHVAEAVSAAPARVITNRAVLLAEMGRRAEALAAIERALVLEPRQIDAWHTRAKLTRYAPGDPDLAVMEAIADRPDAPYRDRVHLSFALGRAHLDMGDGARAFARLNAGAQLKRATLNYDPDADRRRFAGISETFSQETLARLGGAGHASDRPIFVFGMPRSGTTLVEQILASHAEVHGAGEPVHLADMAETMGLSSRIATLTPGDFAALGRLYLELVGAGVPETWRVVDKTPLNFLYAGLISLILPNARMIHCRRDPLDTCLSGYSLLFARGHEYSYEFTELGRFHRLYQRLMAHWRQVLPPDNLLEIDYESLVGDTEAETRRLLAFCGLSWDDACLRFHETPRRVASASLDQVRSPIYTTSLGRAQSFRPWLGALEAALAEPP
jgi:tetratricopeptide (TPR) repeat protein